MPPQLALLLTILFIFYLFIQDFRQKPNISSAVWIPCIWIMILGSRAVSQWLNPGAPFQGANDLIEGSPIDRAVFLLLMAAGLLVLWKRQIPWSQVFRNNVWLTLFFGYCAVSILWSDIPSLAFKRWIKGLGDPMMVLILLSEREPVRAIETVIKRCAYVLIPLSILFIKYYPHLGAGYSEWTGEAYYTGVTTGKNLLGLLCFVAGLFFVCKLIVQLGRGRKSGKKTDLLVTILFLLMIGWLFRISDSKTPLMSLVLGILVVVVLGFPNVKKYSGSFIVAGILVFSVLQLLFNISEILVLGAGRDPTLTGRTDLWEVLLNMNINPWIGAGFESFWLGERLEKLWAMYWFKPNEAHNGYLEIYLNLGGVGLFFLGGVFFSCYKNMRKSLMLSSEPGRKERVDQGHSVLHFPLASRGLRPLPPWRGKVGMG